MTDRSFDRDRLDRFFDGELCSNEERELLSDARRVDGAFEELAKTRRAIELLQEPVETPDMLQDILGEVNARRAFLPPRWRRVVSVGRLAAAVALLVGVGAVAMVQRAWPEATALTPEPRPISAVVDSGQSEATLCVQEIVDGFESFASLAPVFEEPAVRESLRLTDGDRPGTLRLAFEPAPDDHRPVGRVVSVGWSRGPAYGYSSDVSQAGPITTGAMPFEVFDSGGTFRVVRVRAADDGSGRWVVPEGVIAVDEPDSGDARD